MKKIIAITLAMFIAMALYGCADKTTEDEDPTILSQSDDYDNDDLNSFDFDYVDQMVFFYTWKKNCAGELVDTITKEDSDGDESYIPVIKMTSPAVEAINAKIWNCYISAIEESVDGWYVKYGAYINEGTLSLGVEYIDVYGEVRVYLAYNIDIATEQPIDNTELLCRKGISQEEYLYRIRRMQTEFFFSRFGTREEFIENGLQRNSYFDGDTDKVTRYSEILGESYDYMYEATFAPENCSMELPVIMGENGDLLVFMTTASLGGPLTVDLVWNIDVDWNYEFSRAFNETGAGEQAIQDEPKR